MPTSAMWLSAKSCGVLMGILLRTSGLNFTTPLQTLSQLDPGSWGANWAFRFNYEQ